MISNQFTVRDICPDCGSTDLSQVIHLNSRVAPVAVATTCEDCAFVLRWTDLAA
ncbi:hypothetical protein [Nocardioides sp. HB32]